MLITKSQMIGIFLIFLGYLSFLKKKKKNGTGLMEFLPGVDPRVVLKCFSLPIPGKMKARHQTYRKAYTATPQVS